MPFLRASSSLGTILCVAFSVTIFYGNGITEQLNQAIETGKDGGAVVFGYYVDHPEAFGVAEFDEPGKAISIGEKPKKPKSNYIVPGPYFYDKRV